MRGLTLGPICRVGLPAWRTAYHGLRVVKVVREADDVLSLVVRGRRLERPAMSGGQYFHWRFTTRGLWLHWPAAESH